MQPLHDAWDPRAQRAGRRPAREHARALELRVSRRGSVSAPQTIEDACAFAWLQCAAVDGTPPQRDAQDAVDRGAPRAGIADWRRYLAGAGEIQRTLVATATHAARSPTLHVIGPCDGVLAFCVDVAACERRLRGAA